VLVHQPIKESIDACAYQSTALFRSCCLLFHKKKRTNANISRVPLFLVLAGKTVRDGKECGRRTQQLLSCLYYGTWYSKGSRVGVQRQTFILDKVLTIPLTCSIPEVLL